MATPFPFGSGNVLTAAQMNAITTLPVSTKTVSYVLTVADLGTRVVMNSASATTITVNTSIFGASDKVEILNIGAGVCTVTAGTCTVGTTGNLALAQNAGGTLTFISASASVFRTGGVTAAAGGLTLISATTVGTTVASVTISGAFSSTYDNYKIFYTGGANSAAETDCRMTLGSTTTGYYSIRVGYRYAASALDFVDANNGSNFLVAGATGNTVAFNIDLLQPNLAKPTYFNSIFNATVGVATCTGYQSASTQYTAFTLSPDSGTFTGGTVYVYGYANS
jgi:hypothetical protein